MIKISRKYFWLILLLFPQVSGSAQDRVEYLDTSGCTIVPDPHFLSYEIKRGGVFNTYVYAIDTNSYYLYNWNFSDEAQATGINAEHFYTPAGFRDVSLTITDLSLDNCKVKKTREIKVWSQFDQKKSFFFFHGQGCETLQTYLCYRAKTPDEKDLEWRVSNGDVYKGYNPLIKLDSPGVYTIELYTDGAFRPGDIDSVQVFPSPDAGFSWLTKDDTSVLKGSYETIFISSPQVFPDTNYRYEWYFANTADGVVRYDYTPAEHDEEVSKTYFLFPDTGWYNPSLTISYRLNKNLCESFFDTLIYIKDDLLSEYIVPNVVIMNNNDFGRFGISSNGKVPLILKVYSRTGALIYEEKNVILEWNMITPHNIKLAPGVYFYTLEAEDGSMEPRGDFFQVFE